MQIHRVQELFKQSPVGQRVSVCGWVRTRRDAKNNFSFLEINDGSCLKNLQVIADGTLENYETEVKKLGTGSSLRVEGIVVASQGKEQAIEIKAERVHVYGFASEDFPLQKKRHGFDYLRTIGHLRPRTNTFGAVTRIRHTLSMAVHDFFHSRGFFYVQTPIITANDAEGAGEMFQVTTLDLDKLPRTPEGKIDYTRDFFGRRTSLTVSGQLEGETYAMALGNIYTFGPTFRAENSNTTRHLAEFWMIEPEMAFADLDHNAYIAEEFLKHVIRAVLEQNQEDLNLLDSFVQKGLKESLQNIVAGPFARMTYTEAIEVLEKSGQKFEYPAKWGSSLQTEHERYLTEVHLKKPVILTDYPKDFTAFYMRLNDDKKTVRNMDVLVPQIGEIIGGSQREERLDVLLERMQEAGLKPEDYEFYLDLRKYGTAPHAGFGLGFERLVLLCTGMGNIRDVIPFPRTPGHCEF
ncbi:asparagine--tRNA ligase [Polyangium jinanense]|uniref:Asparagine--tRNA ligase n=1 Tax=Polyangium jinanense TaxID=2829994 RepID=A0A9X4AQK8_9BACT|nr:asparagine--tRNA ligase [Polyangium jinanense]MDC3955031.1 asparagine--tRNA ligase [Polyangium jinanense]MDC3981199.1 asparagine--tRNA ligase [Polyangium jinanense]